MNSGVFASCKLIFCVFSILTLSACVTTFGDHSTTNNNPRSGNHAEFYAEREALRGAAMTIARTPWPEPAQVSLTDRVSGMVLGNAKTGPSGDSVELYLQTLEDHLESLTSYEKLRALDNKATPAQGGMPMMISKISLLERDADTHLKAAYALTDAAYGTLTALKVSSSDILLVENAIGDLRAHRTVYLSTLKKLAKEGEAITDSDVKNMKQAFIDAARALGEAADALADQAAHEDNRKTLARPDLASDLAGS